LKPEHKARSAVQKTNVGFNQIEVYFNYKDMVMEIINKDTTRENWAEAENAPWMAKPDTNMNLGRVGLQAEEDLVWVCGD
jgi:hypothetical protein